MYNEKSFTIIYKTVKFTKVSPIKTFPIQYINQYIHAGHSRCPTIFLLRTDAPYNVDSTTDGQDQVVSTL